MGKIADQLKDLRETADSLPQIIDSFTSLLNTPFGAILLIIGIVSILLKIDSAKLIELIGRKTEKKLALLDGYLSNQNHADPASLSAMQDIRTANYFKIATGIYAEKTLRDALIRLHEKTSYQISWTTIRRAFFHIKLDAYGNVCIGEFSLFEKFTIIWSKFAGGLLMSLGTFHWALSFISTSKSLLPLIIALIPGFLFVAIGMLIYSLSNLSEKSALKIKKELEQLNAQALAQPSGNAQSAEDHANPLPSPATPSLENTGNIAVA